MNEETDAYRFLELTCHHERTQCQYINDEEGKIREPHCPALGYRELVGKDQRKAVSSGEKQPSNGSKKKEEGNVF